MWLIPPLAQVDPANASLGWWGNVASIVGVGLSIIGFGFTIFGVYKSKSAAVSAADSARQTKRILLRANAMTDLSAAVAMMDEVKRLHRAEAWAILPDRYGHLRRMLISISSENTFPEHHLTLIKTAIGQFRQLEMTVDEALPNDTDNLNVAKLNRIVSAQIDKLQEILNVEKSSVGEKNE